MRWIHYGQEITIPGLTVVSCLQDNRFSEPHDALQAKQSFVRWIHYGQEIAIPELTVVSCLQDNRFSEHQENDASLKALIYLFKSSHLLKINLN